MRILHPRSAMRSLAAALLVGTVVALGHGLTVGHGAAASEESPVVGRFSVVSEAGGAVWAFQPGGSLVLVGPGDLVSSGTWLEGPLRGEFDASVDVEVTGQELTVLGAVSPDGRQVALFVHATEATRRGNWDPWPSESRLLGDLLTTGTEETPSPDATLPDCLRPAWRSGEIVDWDRCEEAHSSMTPGGDAAVGG
jgi:hypothetical protein